VLKVAENENQASAIRGPFEVVNALRNVSEVSGFTSEAAEQPDLGLAIVSCGEESEVLAVGAPAGMRGRDAFGGQGDGIAAVGGDHPEALLVLVFLEHAGAHGVGDPLAIGTQFGLGDFANLEVVVNGDVAGRGGSRLGGRFLRLCVYRKTQSQGRECDSTNDFHAHDS